MELVIGLVLILLALSLWPLTLALIVFFVVKALIKHFGLRIDCWFFRIDIKPFDYHQQWLDETRPLEGVHREIAMRMLKREGRPESDIEYIRVLR